MKAQIALGSICLVSWFLFAAQSQGKSGGRVIFVDDDGADCHGAQFSSIQAAIDQASLGDTIRVCNGVYNETLSISKSIEVVADSGAFLVPNAVPQNSESLSSGAPIAAAVYVSSAKDVGLFGLSIDGRNSAITGCAPDLVGVYFQNASGHAAHLTIRNFRLGSGLAGCQSGTGILVQSGNGGTSTVEIEDCVLHDFQKNGITANEVGTTVLIHDNTVNGLGPTTGAAQNGIQIGFGAQGAIVHNTISSSLWSPCVTDNCSSVGTGILIDDSDHIVTERNRISHAQVGIFVVGNQAALDSNRVSDSQVFDGIRIVGDRNSAKCNQVDSSGEAGLFLQGSDNQIEDNTVTESPIGIMQTPGSSKNRIATNKFFATTITIQDPITIDLQRSVSPDR